MDRTGGVEVGATEEIEDEIMSVDELETELGIGVVGEDGIGTVVEDLGTGIDVEELEIEIEEVDEAMDD